MADELRTYDEVLGDIAGGARHTSDRWPEWYDETSGKFEDRVRKVFEAYGIMPTPAQFGEAQSRTTVAKKIAKEEAEAKD